jgi:hypothetical protein
MHFCLAILHHTCNFNAVIVFTTPADVEVTPYADRPRTKSTNTPGLFGQGRNCTASCGRGLQRMIPSRRWGWSARAALANATTDGYIVVTAKLLRHRWRKLRP